MCIVVVALQQHPSYPLILASNRDEFRSRPSRSSGWWDDADHHPRILAGKDMKESGTWLGITKSGRIACITNHRDIRNGEERTDAPSRGRLVPEYLAETLTPSDFVQQFNDAFNYNGFNLILGQLSSSALDFRWCSNISYPSSVSEPQRLLQQQHLDAGLHVLANAHLNTPWPKSEKLRGHLYEIVNQATKGISNADTDNNSGMTELVNAIFQALQDPEPTANADELPDTGFSVEWERLLSSIFINTPTCGTVSSTVIVMDTHQKVRWEERSYDATGTVSNTVVHEFHLSDSSE